jgi:hypothetical protein
VRHAPDRAIAASHRRPFCLTNLSLSEASNDKSHGRLAATVALVTCIDRLTRATLRLGEARPRYFEKSATMVPTLAPSAALNAPR